MTYLFRIFGITSMFEKVCLMVVFIVNPLSIALSVLHGNGFPMVPYFAILLALFGLNLRLVGAYFKNRQNV